MPLVRTSIPNLINGVSQQPSALRLPTQCEEMVNCYPTVVEGLIKRPPLEHIDEIISGDAGSSYVHIYQRDTAEQYVIVVRNGDIDVFDMDGVAQTVNKPDGVGYLAVTDAQAEYRLMTVADYTFIVNKSVTAAMQSSPVVAGNAYKGMVFVRQGTYGGTYTVQINGVTQATFTTSTTVVTQVATDYIATQLASQLVTNLGAGWTVVRKNHVIAIRKNDGTDFTVATTDPLGGEGMKGNNGTVNQSTDLPTVAVQGHIVKVSGDNVNDADDYYVKFVANDGTMSEGFWKEAAGTGAETTIDPSTMPHVLIASSPGVFSFEEAVWDTRDAGDSDSSPDPSFIDNEITDIAFFRDRLVFLSGQNCVMSKAGSYFDFFPDTVRDVLDDAPIDVAAAHTKVALLRHAVPFNKQLLLFSDQTQFVLDSDELLTPKTAAITTATEFEASEVAKPVGAGHNVYFITEKGDFSGVREYFVDQDSETNDAADVTAHIPQYIPNDIRFMEVSTSEDVLVMASQDATHDHEVYVYKYYWQGNEKLQSAWGQWDISQDSGDTKIRAMQFINSTLYFVIQRHTDALYLERVRLEAARVDDYQDYVTLLDRRITDADCTTVAYDSGTGMTTWTLPYTIRSNSMAIVTRGNVGGDVHGRELTLETYAVGDTTLKVAGDFSARDVWIGNKYTATYTPSEPVVKEPSDGGGTIAIQSGIIQVRGFSLAYDNTGYFQVEVTPLYRDTNLYPFTGRITGAGANILGAPAIASGTHRASVLANSRQFSLSVTSDSPMPMKLQSAEWELFYHNRSRRP